MRYVCMSSYGKSTGPVYGTARSTMTSQFSSTTADISTEDGNNATIMERSTSRLGKRKRDEVDDASYLTYKTPQYIEVDEDDNIRGFHVSPYCPISRLYIRDRDLDTPGLSQNTSIKNTIQWRAHKEVAIEIAKYNHIMVLHDLVDQNNSHIMVLAKDHAIIQGRYKQVFEMLGKVEALWDRKDGKSTIYSLTFVSGAKAREIRQQRRKGGLVDAHFKYIPMDWAEADKLMSKDYREDDGEPLVVIQLRPDDTSPPGNLKPGRRLVPIDELV
ncbi:hypothetical protein M434DRAFT_13317 [Hypoxylon sp. CO27-5]|nr:hypothetical protein M434DRAFT_13317 [Hypoxylon sp. CO27-5]